MAAQPYEQRELAIPFMNGLNRAVQNNLVLSGSFPYASAAALIAAAILSNRYIPARQLPDKAIDLMDEAASSLRIR